MDDAARALSERRPRLHHRAKMATIAALVDGVKDARTGRDPYFGTVRPSHRPAPATPAKLSPETKLAIEAGMADAWAEFHVMPRPHQGPGW